jgi:hypothetical protein
MDLTVLCERCHERFHDIHKEEPPKSKRQRAKEAKMRDVYRLMGRDD